MTMLDVRLQSAIEARDDEWVTKANALAEELTRTVRGRQDRVRQVRNLQSIAEQTTSWEALALFMSYQGARGELDKRWVNRAIADLRPLREEASKFVKRVQAPDPAIVSRVHMTLVARVLGYTARAHYVHMKNPSERDS